MSGHRMSLSVAAGSWLVSYTLRVNMFQPLHGNPSLRVSQPVRYMVLPMDEFFHMMNWYGFSYDQAFEVALILRRFWFGQEEMVVVPYVWVYPSPSPPESMPPTIISECVLYFLQGDPTSTATPESARPAANASNTIRYACI